MDVFLGPAHFRDVHQTFDARFQLDEGAVVGDVRDAALQARIFRVLRNRTIPWISFKLFHTQADPLRFHVEADDLHFKLLANRERFGRMIDALPRNIGDMEQAVDATEIHERAVVGDVFDHAVEHLAFFQVFHQLRALASARFFHHSAARDDDIAAGTVHFQNLERLRSAHQMIDVFHRADVDLAAGQEGHCAIEIDCEAAFDATEDDAFDVGVFFVLFFQRIPSFFAARFVARKNNQAFAVFITFNEHMDAIPSFHLGLSAIARELFQRDAAFRLQADVDQHGVVVDTDHRAMKDGALNAVVLFK